MLVFRRWAENFGDSGGNSDQKLDFLMIGKHP